MAIPTAAMRWTAILWLPALVFLFGLSTTWFSANSTTSATQALLLKSLHDQEKLLSETLRTKISQLIDDGQRLADFPSETYALFQHRAGILLGNHNYVVAVEFLQQIPEEMRAATEKELSEEAGQPIRFGRWQQGRARKPLAPADNYLVVRWSRTQPGSLVADSAVGLVATSVPYWRYALKLALEEGRVGATPITEVQRGGVYLDAFRLFIPVSEHSLVSLAIDPQEWLSAIFRDLPTPALELAVHDLSQHSKLPLYQRSTDSPTVKSLMLRSEFALGDRNWMLTITPSRHAMTAASTSARWRTILSGFLLTVLAASITGWLSARVFDYKRRLARSKRRTQQVQKGLDNFAVERAGLHRALSDSEQRSRDLVALSGGVISELDENLLVGYISDQVVDLLQSAPAELVNRPFLNWVAPAAQSNFTAALRAAREEGSIIRLDTQLRNAEGALVAVTCRFKALIDPIHGFTGFRMSAQRRP